MTSRRVSTLPGCRGVVTRRGAGHSLLAHTLLVAGNAISMNTQWALIWIVAKLINPNFTPELSSSLYACSMSVLVII